MLVVNARDIVDSFYDEPGWIASVQGEDDHKTIENAFKKMFPDYEVWAHDIGLIYVWDGDACVVSVEKPKYMRDQSWTVYSGSPYNGTMYASYIDGVADVLKAAEEVVSSYSIDRGSV